MLEARAEADETGIGIGSRTVNRTKQGVLPLGPQEHAGRNRPVDAKTGCETADVDVLLPGSG